MVAFNPISLFMTNAILLDMCSDVHKAASFENKGCKISTYGVATGRSKEYIGLLLLRLRCAAIDIY
jgi:hypothetical protein